MENINKTEQTTSSRSRDGQDCRFSLEMDGAKYEVMDNLWASGYLTFERELSQLLGGVPQSPYFTLDVLSPGAALALLPDLGPSSSLHRVSQAVSLERKRLADLIPEVSVSSHEEAKSGPFSVVYAPGKQDRLHWAQTCPGIQVGDYFHAKYPNRQLYADLAAIVASICVPVKVKPLLDLTAPMCDLVLGSFANQVPKVAKTIGRVLPAARKRALNSMPASVMPWEQFATLFSAELGVTNRVVVADALIGSKPDLIVSLSWPYSRGHLQLNHSPTYALNKLS